MTPFLAQPTVSLNYQSEDAFANALELAVDLFLRQTALELTRRPSVHYADLYIQTWQLSIPQQRPGVTWQRSSFSSQRLW